MEKVVIKGLDRRTRAGKQGKIPHFAAFAFARMDETDVRSDCKVG
jgi:hypothetical protein